MHEKRFLDSLRCTPSSLATLADNLPAEKCKNLAQIYQGEKFTLMKQKGEHPYDWIDSHEKLNKK